MSLELESSELLGPALRELARGFEDLPPFRAEVDLPGVAAVLTEVATRLHDNLPYHHPLYAGQMIKAPHPVARMAYIVATWINPNNHALEGGRASAAMEREAVAALAAMFGWGQHLGHLCSGGSVANLEALWVAARLRPGGVILASAQSHYVHGRICELLGVPFEAVAVDGAGRMDMGALRARVARGGVGTVVATFGSTGLGAVDPLPAILELARGHDLRVHIDAAYGGYFALASNLAPRTKAAFERLSESDSIVVDPHKHGLQPFGCGCVIFRDPSVARIYGHDSPCTYFDEEGGHLGEVSLECSRPGAAAVALWATQRHLPMVPGGRFASDLERCREAALWIYARLAADPRVATLGAPELDIVVWAPLAARASAISQRSRALFAAAAARGLHLALVDLDAELLARHWPTVDFDVASVSCLRSCLMKPEHEAWGDALWERLRSALDDLSDEGPACGSAPE